MPGVRTRPADAAARCARRRAPARDVRVATGPDLVGPLRDRGLDVSAVGPAVGRLVGRAQPHLGRPRPSRRPDARRRPGAVRHTGCRPAGRPHRAGGGLAARPGGARGARAGRPDPGPPARGAGRRRTASGRCSPSTPTSPAPAGAAAGDPDLWATLSAETYLDICPPSLRPDGPPAWATSAPLRPSVGERGPVPPAVAELLNDDGPPAGVLHPRHRQEPGHRRLPSRPQRAGRVRRPRARHHRPGARPRRAGARAGQRRAGGVRAPGVGAAARRPGRLAQRVGHDARRAGARHPAGGRAAGHRPARERRPARAGRRRRGRAQDDYGAEALRSAIDAGDRRPVVRRERAASAGRDRGDARRGRGVGPRVSAWSRRPSRVGAGASSSSRRPGTGPSARAG